MSRIVMGSFLFFFMLANTLTADDVLDQLNSLEGAPSASYKLSEPCSNCDDIPDEAEDTNQSTAPTQDSNPSNAKKSCSYTMVGSRYNKILGMLGQKIKCVGGDNDGETREMVSEESGKKWNGPWGMGGYSFDYSAKWKCGCN